MQQEIEYRALGALMLLSFPKDILAQEAMLEADANYFKQPNARDLFFIIHKQFYNDKPFDLETVAALCSADLGLLVYEIASSVWSTNLLINDIEFLRDSYIKNLIDNRIKRLSKEFSKELSPKAACLIATEACDEISKIWLDDDEHIFTEQTNYLNFLNSTEPQTPIISSGIKTIDAVCGGGFKNKSLITIAGRSGMGKTGFAVHLAHHIASNHYQPGVLFYSLEMGASDIYEKQLSSIIAKQIFSATEEERLKATKVSLEVPFTIHCKPLVSIDHIETSARIAAIKNPFSIIVVDYLGIVQNKTKFESHALKQADIALRLAALAIELDCIVIALTQVNRDYSARQDKVPITSDAADSSGSERSSSYWLGIYRPVVDDEHQHENDFVVKCRKNRFGKTWKAHFAFNDGTFGEVDQYLYNAKPMNPTRGIDEFLRNRNKAKR